MIQTAWDELFQVNNHLLVESRIEAVELSTLHPEPTQVSRLWQIYLDKTYPVSKVTHTPRLQGRIVDALSKISRIHPKLEAFMFSIDYKAVVSLVENEVQSIFNSSKRPSYLYIISAVNKR